MIEAHGPNPTLHRIGEAPTRALDEFAAVLEPIVELRSGSPVAHELLLRPRLGGDVVGWHLGRSATAWRWFTQQVLVLAAEVLRGRDLPLHVNVTALDLATPGFARSVIDLVPPSGSVRLVLELTEQFPVLDGPATVTNLVALRRAGVRFAIDDYGEGWSGRATLLLVQPDLVKVTASMLESPAPASSAGEVLALARQVGAATVVEQIERPDQLGWALEAGFTLGQGWLWGGEVEVLL